MSKDTDICFHCGEALRGSTLTATVQGTAKAVCCSGCLAVAELIEGEGLADFYRYRAGPTEKPATTDSWSVYTREDLAGHFVQHSGDRVIAHILIDGLRCAACSWLIDRSLRNLVGVREVSINVATGRARVEWKGALTLADVMRVIGQLGFKPHPVDDRIIANVQRDERRVALKRLAVSGFGMMQVMMFAVAVYSAEINHEVMDDVILRYFRLISLLVATPVFLYAGWPFLRNAFFSLRAKAVGVDAPVALALTLAFIASAWNTFRNTGEVYFDSIAMFIFFLTLGRFVEMSVRQRTTSAADALARHLPVIAHRLDDAIVSDVLTVSLVLGDRILVRPGEIVPADGVIVEGTTRIDEAFLTGESLPLERTIGERVISGALNGEGSIQVRVTATGDKTVLSNIGALLKRTQTEKPITARTADIAAARFLNFVLIGSVVVCGAWLIADPSRAFSATLAMLIAACPCAFSIAMPATLAAATARLARLGLLVVRVDALESLTKVTRCIFDKTGTLTSGDLRLSMNRVHGSLSESEALAVAAILERASEHAIARAFPSAPLNFQARDIRIDAGRGVEGTIAGRRYRIGSMAFVSERFASAPLECVGDSGATTIVLGDEHAVLATFELRDSLRDGAATVAARLHELRIESEILSGDGTGAVSRIAGDCGIETFASRQLPEEKLTRVRELQQTGETVLMVGDGVNDAPVLGAANVSIAMGRGAALAQASADIVFINDSLDALPTSVVIARRALRIARQNLVWSAIYNFTALPLAALGLIPPWLAAVGMSLSSIAVVLNATRLLPKSRRVRSTPEATGSRAARATLVASGAPS